jgi:arginyl-tRNA synthetase
MIYVVGDQQDLHVAQFFKILSLMEVPFADRLEHVNFGRVNGMSTRKGEVKVSEFSVIAITLLMANRQFLEDILDTAKEAMTEQMLLRPQKYDDGDDPEWTSDQVGMAAVKIQDMQAKRCVYLSSTSSCLIVYVESYHTTSTSIV